MGNFQANGFQYESVAFERIAENSRHEYVVQSLQCVYDYLRILTADLFEGELIKISKIPATFCSIAEVPLVFSPNMRKLHLKRRNAYCSDKFLVSSPADDIIIEVIKKIKSTGKGALIEQLRIKCSSLDFYFDGSSRWALVKYNFKLTLNSSHQP